MKAIQLPLTLLFLGLILVFFLWNNHIFLLGPLFKLRAVIPGLLPLLTFYPLAAFLLQRAGGENELTPSERILYRSFLALTLASAAAFLLLTLRIAYPLTLYFLSALSLIVSLRWWKGRLVQAWRGGGVQFSLEKPLCSWFLLAAAGMMAVAASLSPPIGYDAHEYHLAVPQQYLRAGAWIAFPYNVYAAFPMNVEMLYLWPIAAESTTGCKTVNLVFAFLTALALIRLAKMWGISEWLTVPVVFLGTGQVMRMVLSANIDIALTCSTAVLLLAYERFHHKKRSIDLYMMIAALGFGLGAKYIAIISILAPFLALILYDGFMLRRRDLIKPMFLAICGAALLFAPWLIRNLLIYHNPVYPLLPELFGGLPAYFFDLFRVAHRPHSEIEWPLAAYFFLLPFIKSFPEFAKTGFSCLWTLGAPALLSIRKESPVTRSLLFMAVVYVAWFFATQRNDRFLASLLPMLSLLPFLGLKAIAQKELKILYHGVIVFVLAFQLWTLAPLALNRMTVEQMFTPTYESEYFAQHLPHYRAIEELNRLVDLDTRAAPFRRPDVRDVLFIGEAQTYGAKFNVIAPTVFNHHPLETELPPTVSHVVYNRMELERLHQGYGPLGWPLGEELQNWVNRASGVFLEPVFDADPNNPGSIVIFAVRQPS